MLHSESQNSTKPDFLTGFGVPLFLRSYNQAKQPAENAKGYVSEQLARNIIKCMFSEASFDLSIFNFSILKKSGTEIYSEFRATLQEIFINIHYHSTHHDQEHAEHFIENKELQLSALITNSLSLIPYAEPENDHKFVIPQKINGLWQMVEYETERIKLTPEQFGSPYFAYGLKPINNSEAQALLLFMGTNPLPHATGAHHTFMADFMPFHSVGEHLYRADKDKLHAWVNAQYDITSKPVIAHGHSLGASLAVIAHVHQPDKIQARAFNPPFWLPSIQKTYNQAKERLLAQSKDITDDPIIIFSQHGDPVCSIGFLLETDQQTKENKSPKVYKITSNIGNKTSYIGRHKDSYAAHSANNGLKFEEMEAQQINKSILRIIMTILWQVVSIPLFIINAGIMLIKAINFYVFKLIEYIYNKFKSTPVDSNEALSPHLVQTPFLVKDLGQITDLELGLLPKTTTLVPPNKKTNQEITNYGVSIKLPRLS
jgi:hypothetical protein